MNAPCSTSNAIKEKVCQVKNSGAPRERTYGKLRVPRKRNVPLHIDPRPPGLRWVSRQPEGGEREAQPEGGVTVQCCWRPAIEMVPGDGLKMIVALLRSKNTE